MKHFIVLLLAFQFSTGHNLLSELLRTPMLLDHYDVHRQETPGLGFSEFLWLHYFNAQHEQSDSRHSDLPMHCSHGLFTENAIPHPPQLEQVALPICDTDKSPLLISEEFLRLTAPISGVFRPPIA